MKLRRIVISAFLPLASLLFLSADHAAQKPFDGIRSQFLQWQKAFPEDRVYAMCDKPFYAPGETIWFSVFVREGSTLAPSVKSEIVHVELLNPKGSVEKKLTLFAKKGIASGDLTLAEEGPGGLYTLKVYTNWQKNDPDPAFFVKELQVQEVVLPRLKMKLDFAKKAYGAGDKVVADVAIETNENAPFANKPMTFTVSIAGKELLRSEVRSTAGGKAAVTFDLPRELSSTDGILTLLIDYDGQTESISRSIPIVLNKISLQFFPEGGDLVGGLTSNLAFKAVNEFGKAADIEGFIVGEGTAKVAEFRSFHQGMGACIFTPQSDVTYRAHITRPAGITDTFDLPEVLPQGYVLTVDNKDAGVLKVSIGATRSETMRLFIQMRGKECYSKEVAAKKGRHEVKVDAASFGEGVAQVTLFDEKGIERAERLVFVNKQQQATVTIKTDKEKYGPREKVKLTVAATDAEGMRMPGHVALSVADDQLLSFSDDKSSTIITHMLCEADVKGKIEEPRFYFDPREPKADKALDLLLCTNGWRRFTWQQITQPDIQPAAFDNEKMEIAGTVLDGATLKGAADVEVRIAALNLRVRTDSLGVFVFKGVELYEPQVLEAVRGVLRAEATVRNYTKELQLWLSPRVHPPVMMMAAPMQNDAMEGVLGGAADDVMENMNIKKNGRMGVRPMPARQRAAQAKPVAQVNKAIPEKKQVPLAKQRMADKAAHARHKAPGMAKKIMKEEALAMDEQMAPPEAPLPQEVVYYRARQYAMPNYAATPAGDARTDFRQTIYWNGDVVLGNNGSATVEFYTNDAITSFRATAEGFIKGGGVGRAEKVFYSQPPFGVSVKLPPVVLTGDTVSLQVLVKNFTDRSMEGTLSLKLPQGCVPISTVDAPYSITAKGSKVVPCTFAAVAPSDSALLVVAFAGDGFSDEMKAPLRVVPQGFPVEASFSGNEMKREFSVTIADVVKRSISATLRAYPSVVSDLLTGIESILSEPYGCFEQTSMTSYPNALVLSYLKSTDNNNSPFVARAEELLEKGYKRLATFETPEKGFEWFGQQPGHEALTAYGLMQFHDMSAVGGIVDKQMVDRTAEWLMKRRDGSGGFSRNPQALDSYGGADQDITNAYIVYALAEAGRRDIQKELDASVAVARTSEDPYLLALVSNALYSFNDDKRGDELLGRALKKQADDGSWCGTRHSITRSGGISLKLETTALVCLAIMKSKSPDGNALTTGVKFIVNSRSGDGGFGATQSTILSLKALTAYAQFARKTDAPGVIVVSVNGKDVARKDYAAGEKDAIIIDSLEKYIATGTSTVGVRFESTKSPLPYSLAINYCTWKPLSSPECKVALTVSVAQKEVAVGATCRITAHLKNTTQEGLPMTLAIVGIPAGLSAQPWQLKELQEKKIVDFYEVSGSEVVFYYRQMKPSEERTIILDCKAEVPGKYTAKASRAYLYYTNEFKVWTAIEPLRVTSGK